jgi:hypothetical protein
VSEGLTGGDFPDRPIFWHFPHYTNQGSRPGGAMRDGNWLLVELYDEDIVELYDLSTDIGEQDNVAAQHPDRVAAMHAALDAWRKENDVQYNRPNPDCDEAQFQALYVDVDASRFDPLDADEEEWERMQAWRAGMNEVCRKE